MAGASDWRQRAGLTIFALSLLFVDICRVQAYPLEFVDAGGFEVVITGPPQRVVSLMPTVTDIIFQLGAGEAVQGLTYHDRQSAEAAAKTIVGGFFAPSPAVIEKLAPDVIFIAGRHQAVRDQFAGRPCRVIQLEPDSLQELYHNIQLLGRIFAKEKTAEAIVAGIQDEIRLIADKLDKVPAAQRKRVMRFMGRDRVMTPGDDSFQNEFIRAAGGIPPRFGKKGELVEIDLESWRQFNPQVIYGCGGDRAAIEELLTRPGWKDVEAVRNDAIFFFPCDLTCRNSVHAGKFIAWLAATIYAESFGRSENLVLPEKTHRRNAVDLSLDYVRTADVVESTVFDFPNKTLVLEFKQPMRIISTLEGERDGIRSVGNHYSPAPTWGITHLLGLERSRHHIYQALGKSAEKSSFLFTGADLSNLSVQKKTYKDLTVYALVTAGVESNAVRMAMDEGRFYEPGTINVIILSNRRLSSRAMARAVISATEAKTAALQDLDVRGSAVPRRWQATGTGTDEVLVVAGSGAALDNTGGHSKLGELIAVAVYAGVREAISRQNALVAPRSVFHRLRERRLDPYGLLRECSCLTARAEPAQALTELETILLEPRYAAFVEASLALSDAYDRRLVSDLAGHDQWCRRIAEEIAGGKVTDRHEMITAEDMPVVLRMSLNALLNGLNAKLADRRSTRGR